ncbi:MAG: prepilin-type N-terminal cleavage/methylation domain-containing protein [Bryobacter sp.]|nr:prepilin-type N-terminal cleavage/methylation domain-containing protein [Bryobacter sp.]
MAKQAQRGVTLLELLLVVTLVALMAGLALPSFSGGMDTLRLRSAAGSVAGALNYALRTAERRQLPVELTLAPARGAVLVRTATSPTPQTFALPAGIRLGRILPSLFAQELSAERVLILDPQGAPPALLIELLTPAGKARYVRLDPLTNSARVVEAVEGNFVGEFDAKR